MADPVLIEADVPRHAGEFALQDSLGLADQVAPMLRHAIRDHLTAQHRAFFPQLPFLVAGAVDPAGDPWATLIAGPPGFLAAPDPVTLTVAGLPDPEDPAAAGITEGAALGLLGIDLATRRRNRLNGEIVRRDAAGFAVRVRESFGNCPRYIRPRQLRPARDPAATGRPEPSTALDAPARAMLAAAETLFLASYVDGADGRRRVDVSHRGGAPGFVRVGPDGALTIPDYAGNRYFNTLGNIRANPRAGILVPDFATGDLLQISGPAQIVLDEARLADLPGAERLLVVRPDTVVRRPAALPLRLPPDTTKPAPS